MFQYGQVKVYDDNRKPSYTPNTKVGEIYVKGTLQNPTFWYLDRNNVEHQIAGDGAGILQNYQQGFIGLRQYWDSVSSTNVIENFVCTSRLLCQKITFGSNYKFNRIRFKRDATGLAGDIKVVVYDNVSGDLVVESAVTAVGNLAAMEYVDVVLPDMSQETVGSKEVLIGLASSNSNVKVMGYANDQIDGENKTLAIGGDFNLIPSDISTLVDCPAFLVLPWFELYQA